MESFFCCCIWRNCVRNSCVELVPAKDRFKVWRSRNSSCNCQKVMSLILGLLDFLVKESKLKFKLTEGIDVVLADEATRQSERSMINWLLARSVLRRPRAAWMVSTTLLWPSNL